MTISWIIGSRVGNRFLTREVGIGSSSQDAELHFWIIADNSSSEISLNSLKHVFLLHLRVDIVRKSQWSYRERVKGCHEKGLMNIVRKG